MVFHIVFGIQLGQKFFVLFKSHVLLLFGWLVEEVFGCAFSTWCACRFLIQYLKVSLILLAILFIYFLLLGSQIFEMLNFLRCCC